MTEPSKKTSNKTKANASKQKLNDPKPAETGTSPFPNESSEFVPNTSDETPCANGAPCANDGGGGSNDPGQGGGGGSKSGLSIRATRPTVQGTDEAAGDGASRMVVFYMECDGTELESLGLDELFKALSMRAQQR